MEYFYPTSIGREYAAKTATGKILKITKGKFGDGIRTTETISELTDLINPLGELPISKKSSKSNTVTITTQFSNFVNDAILPTFYLSEVGLFGKIVNEDGSDDPEYPETMLGYAFDNPGDKIEGVLTEFILNFPITVTDVANVSVSVSSMAYVTQEDFDEHFAYEKEKFAETDKHIANKNNPHKVTKEQIGLAYVNNTSDASKPLSNAARQENYYPEYSADEVDENTVLYFDIAGMILSNGKPQEPIYKRRVRGIKGTSYWHDLASSENTKSITLTEQDYQTDGIISGTTPRTLSYGTDYLCFDDKASFTIAFSAKFPHTAEKNDLFVFGNTGTMAIQQNGSYGIRLVTFDNTITQCCYPNREDRYCVEPNTWNEYHHYAVVFDVENSTVTWYQDGGVADTAEMTNNEGSIRLQGGGNLTFFNNIKGVDTDGNDNVFGLQYFKVVNKALTAEEVDGIYQKHSVINYTGDITQYDNKFREQDEKISEVESKIPEIASVIIGTTSTKGYCDFRCDGTNDVEVFNAALAKVRSQTNRGGTILLKAGTYYIKNGTVALDDTAFLTDYIFKGEGGSAKTRIDISDLEANKPVFNGLNQERFVFEDIGISATLKDTDICFEGNAFSFNRCKIVVNYSSSEITGEGKFISAVSSVDSQNGYLSDGKGRVIFTECVLNMSCSGTYNCFSGIVCSEIQMDKSVVMLQNNTTVTNSEVNLVYEALRGSISNCTIQCFGDNYTGKGPMNILNTGNVALLNNTIYLYTSYARIHHYSTSATTSGSNFVGNTVYCLYHVYLRCSTIVGNKFLKLTEYQKNTTACYLHIACPATIVGNRFDGGSTTSTTHGTWYIDSTSLTICKDNISVGTLAKGTNVPTESVFADNLNVG